MAKKKYDEEEGVWRTIGGRRVFIRKGQSLSDAMKESGKFKNMRKDIKDNVEFKDMKEDTVKRQGVTAEEYQRAENNVAQLKKERDALLNEEIELQKNWDMSEEPDSYLEDTAYARIRKDDELEEAQKRYDKLMAKDGYMERKYNMPSEEQYSRIQDGKEIHDVFRQMSDKEMKAYAEKFPESIKKMQEYTKQKYSQVDKDWTDLAKKMEKDYDEYGGNTVEDMKRLNELSAERDRLSLNLNNEKLGKKEKTGNDYLPKASKIETAGTSNRKEVSDNIQAHILEHYDNPVDFMEQMDAMDYLPTRWRAGEELASGGSYLIYYDDQRDFLNSLNINPKGKEFSDDRVFQTYNSLIGRESERLYNRLEKLYEQYKKEHKNSNATLNDFRKWFK